MFKKRGGLAFKPKIPIKPRATAPPPSNPIEKSPDPVAESITEELATEAPNVPQTEAGPEDASIAEPEPPTTSNEQEVSEPTPPPRNQNNDKPSDSEVLAQATPEIPAESDAPAKPAAPKEPQTRPTPSVDEVVDTTEQPAREGTNPEPETPATDVSQTGQQAVSRQISSEAPEVTESRAEPSTQSTPAATPSSSKPKPKAKSAPPKKRATRSASSKKQASDEASATDAPQPKKRQKRAKRTQEKEDELPDEDDDDDNDDDESRPAPKKRRKKASAEGEQAIPTRKRSMTPEDAEAQLVDHQKLTMADLTKDLHIGKKFSRHDELRERERQARAKGKQEKESEEASNSQGESLNNPSPGAANQDPAASSTPSEPQQGSGVQFRIVDGQIVLDQSSLVMDRHARAVAAQQDMETIEENDFTRLITSSSFMTTSKLKGPNIWTPEETQLFYRGLAMFGTDFQIIAKMFPAKQRRHVKLKFNREEKHNPKLIDAALIGKKTTMMDMEEYKSLTGEHFESVETIEAQHRKKEEEFETAQKRLADEQAENMRKKREELFADDKGGNTDKHDAKRKKKGKTKKRINDPSLGDPEIVEAL